MTRILFVCHGNICRSPMAEFVMKDLILQSGLSKDVFINSAATTREAIGGDVHPGTREVLRAHGVPFTKRQARQITREEYSAYDMIVAMDAENLRDLSYMTGGDPDKKVRLLLAFAGEDRDVADPWYTGDFEATFRDVRLGCTAILNELQKRRRS